MWGKGGGGRDRLDFINSRDVRGKNEKGGGGKRGRDGIGMTSFYVSFFFSKLPGGNLGKMKGEKEGKRGGGEKKGVYPRREFFFFSSFLLIFPFRGKPPWEDGRGKKRRGKEKRRKGKERESSLLSSSLVVARQKGTPLYQWGEKGRKRKRKGKEGTRKPGFVSDRTSLFFYPTLQ